MRFCSMRASISVSFNINASIVFLIDIAILSCFFGRVFHGWTALLIPAATQARYSILDKSSSPVNG